MARPAPGGKQKPGTQSSSPTQAAKSACAESKLGESSDLRVSCHFFEVHFSYLKGGETEILSNHWFIPKMAATFGSDQAKREVWYLGLPQVLKPSLPARQASEKKLEFEVKQGLNPDTVMSHTAIPRFILNINTKDPPWLPCFYM